MNVSHSFGDLEAQPQSLRPAQNSQSQKTQKDDAGLIQCTKAPPKSEPEKTPETHNLRKRQKVSYNLPKPERLWRTSVTSSGDRSPHRGSEEEEEEEEEEAQEGEILYPLRT